MIYKTLSQLPKTLTIVLSVIGTYGSVSLPSQAILVQQLSSENSRQLQDNGAPDQRGEGGTHVQNLFKNSPLLQENGAPAPGNRVGGGSRSGQSRCPVASKRLTALVPIISANSGKSQNPVLDPIPPGSVFSLTAATHPTFWFYFPYSFTSEYPVEFILKDDQGKIIYQTVLSPGTAPGVVGFKLPDTAPPLELNKRYQWFFSVSCASKDSNRSEQDETLRIFVSGWVERIGINPSLKQKLEQATPQQQGMLYAEAGIWQEAVTALAQLRRQNSNDVTLKAEWVKLLESINLEAIAAEPITSMLTPLKMSDIQSKQHSSCNA